MKNEPKTHLILLFIFAITFLTSCTNTPPQQTVQKELFDTIITMRMDTVVVFDPETKDETVTLTKYEDTTIVKRAK
ncbi:MAG: hypothetical protein M3Q56_13435 [Bacteroidota bacterium]|nr:hypothetical protein [Bacteroidota bacterium]